MDEVPSNHPFKTLLEKDTPLLVIENGAFSDWNYNRIYPIEMTVFVIEMFICAFALGEFEIRKY